MRVALFFPVLNFSTGQSNRKAVPSRRKESGYATFFY
jgi:hypothetical protein